MKKTAFVILAILSLLFSGCATNSIPPEKQKDFALIKVGDFKVFSTAINDIDGTIIFDLINAGRDVLPGQHKVGIQMCLSNRCTQKYYTFDSKAGLAYILQPGRIVVVNRFDFKNTVDSLEQIIGASETSPYYTSDERKKYDAERAKHADESKQRESEAAAAALAVVTERRTKNLPLVKKIGARICQEKTESQIRPRYNNPFVYVYVGYVESLAEDKVQIRISDAYRKGSTPSPKSRPEGFTSSVVWDSPLNWDLCE